MSEEGKLSALFKLQSGDILDFGVDIKDDDGNSTGNIHLAVLIHRIALYTKVSCKVTVVMDNNSNSTIRPSATATSPKNDTVVTYENGDLLMMLQVLF